MATLYCDFENGNDNYGGTSFAVLAQGTNGRITSTTFSSTGASFPNDGSLIGQYLSIFNGTSYLTFNITAWVSSTSLTIAVISGGDALANQAVDRQYYIGGRWKSLTTGATAARLQAGDTVRVMGSPAPTSLGQNGVWTSQTLQATKSISSSTNATPIAITCTAHGYSTGDTVVITGHLTNTNANGTWEITSTGANTFTLDGSVGNGVGAATGTARLRNNTRVMLTTAVTQNIASTGPGRAAWTASTNVTTSLNTTQKEHVNSDSIATNASFTTGKAAYYTLPSTLDLSGYQQVSFWIQQTAGTIGAAGAVDIRLCSDTLGATAVNTINIPNLVALSRWMPVTVDLGANLGSSIRSIAFYVNTNNGAQTFLLNNIIACKASSAADSLSLTSLIGKNTSGETFWGIQSINGRRVMLDMDTNATPASTTLRGYYGTSETVTTWKRETIKLGPAAASTTALQTIQESGTDGNPITFSGGWDRTAMSTQNLETWLDGVNGNGYGLTASSQFLNSEKLAIVRTTIAFFNLNSRSDHNIIAANNNAGSGLAAIYVVGVLGCNLTLGHGVANGSNAVIFGSGGSTVSGILTLNHACASNNGSGLQLGLTGPAYLSKVVKGTGMGLMANNAATGIALLSQDCFIDSLQMEFNSTSAGSNAGGGNKTVFRNCLMADSVEFSSSNYEVVFSHNHDQIAGNHKIFSNGVLISAATDQRYTATGFSWKIQPTSTAVRSAQVPASLPLAKVACAANFLVTVSAWMRRDNSGLTMRLVCKGGQLTGVANDVVSTLSTTNAWTQQTITFTPTETGVVEITAEAWGGTTFSGWVDDMTISQA